MNNNVHPFAPEKRFCPVLDIIEVCASFGNDMYNALDV